MLRNKNITLAKMATFLKAAFVLLLLCLRINPPRKQ